MPTKRKEGMRVEKMLASTWRANSSWNRMFGYFTSYLLASKSLSWRPNLSVSLTNEGRVYQTNAVVVVRQMNCVGNDERPPLPPNVPPLQLKFLEKVEGQ